MKVTVKDSCIVHPAEPTWSGRIPLSEFDQIGVLTDIQTIFLYRHSHSNDCLIPQDRVFKTLHDSLTKALVHFYPLAGRLRPLKGARLELECNNKGVVLVQADSTSKLDDMGDFTTPHPDLKLLIPQIDYVSLPIEEIPLVCAQVTQFQCGGISLGFAMSHVIVDGQSGAQFLTRLASLARGEPLGEPPCFDAKLLRAGEPPRAPPRFHHAEFDPPPGLIIPENYTESMLDKATTDAMLRLSRIQLDALKYEANKHAMNINNNRKPYTRYEAITAHIWQTACKARRHLDYQETTMEVTVDIRRRVRPPLPRNFFGNGAMQVLARSTSGKVMAAALGSVAGKIREAIEMVNDEYIQSAIDYLKGVDDLSELQDLTEARADEGPYCGNPNLGVISWMGLALQGLDFGWGKEVLMGPRTHDIDGDVIILPSGEGDGSLVVAVCLQAAFMDDFKKYLYQDIPSCN